RLRVCRAAGTPAPALRPSRRLGAPAATPAFGAVAKSTAPKWTRPRSAGRHFRLLAEPGQGPAHDRAGRTQTRSRHSPTTIRRASARTKTGNPDGERSTVDCGGPDLHR